MTNNPQEDPDDSEQPTDKPATGMADNKSASNDVPNDDSPSDPPPDEDPRERSFMNMLTRWFIEIEPLVEDMIVRAHVRAQNAMKDKTEPNIRYESRKHFLQIFWVMTICWLLYIFLGAAYIAGSGNAPAALMGVIAIYSIAWAIWRFSIHLHVNRKNVFNEAAFKRFRRQKVLAVFGLTAVGSLVFTYIANLLSVAPGWTTVYLVACIVLTYITLREHYKWAELYVVKIGWDLFAKRPENGLFLLAPFNRHLYLLNVNTITRASSYLAHAIGCDRFRLLLDGGPPDEEKDSEGYENAMFWMNSKYIKDGELFDRAINQAIESKRG